MLSKPDFQTPLSESMLSNPGYQSPLSESMSSEPGYQTRINDYHVINRNTSRGLSMESGYHSLIETSGTVNSASSDILSPLLHRSESVSYSSDDNENSNTRCDIANSSCTVESPKISTSYRQNTAAQINQSNTATQISQSESFLQSGDMNASLLLVDSEMLSSLSSSYSAATNESERYGEMSLMDTSYSSMYSSTSTCMDDNDDQVSEGVSIKADILGQQRHQVPDHQGWDASHTGDMICDGIHGDRKLTSNVSLTSLHNAFKHSALSDDDDLFMTSKLENRTYNYSQSSKAETKLPSTKLSHVSRSNADSPYIVRRETRRDTLTNISTHQRDVNVMGNQLSDHVKQCDGLNSDVLCHGSDLETAGGLSLLADRQDRAKDGRDLVMKPTSKRANQRSNNHRMSGDRREIESCSSLVDNGRSLKRIGAGLERSSAALKEGRQRMEEVFGERLAEERGREKHLARHRAMVMNARKRILLETLEALRQQLRDQSSRLQTAYDLVLTSQWNSCAIAAAVTAAAPAAGLAVY